MIEGLHFDVKADELLKHLAKKAKHHKDRHAFYTDKALALKSGGAEAASFSGGDPIQALTQKANEHSSRAEFFAFLESHVITGETYRVTETDLITLEFISRNRW